ncbi:zinc-binding metallopeptidase [Joostella sp.]|uniref:zinc-binding metallopeptidase n=1 Tax=Joostella sp. TaxID=2231138 RepID=UPI003A8F395C
MKLNNIIYSFFLMLLFSACDSEKSLEESILDTSQPALSELDVWLRDSYVSPYNIEVLYEWDDNQVTQSRYLYPPTEENVKPLMEQILDIWINSYSEVGGDDFVREIAPRQIVLVGGYNVNPSGTITLGLAESGNKITLFRVDDLDFSDLEQTRRFFKTIQHEYCHILNQNKIFSESFGDITPSGYDGDWHLTSTENAREEGFITNYAKSRDSEDFAEMTSVMLTNSKEEYEAIIASIESETAVADLRAKEAIVADYFLKEWAIDIYELQAINYNKLIALTQN